MRRYSSVTKVEMGFPFTNGEISIVKKLGCVFEKFIFHGIEGDTLKIMPARTDYKDGILIVSSQK
ncbi:hypothetical protein HN451_03495 [archaeon]|nr:hypothetical protein [archaeon]